jgi:hypothetical protein
MTTTAISALTDEAAGHGPVPRPGSREPSLWPPAAALWPP